MKCENCGASTIWKWMKAEAWWCSSCQAVTFDDVDEEVEVDTTNLQEWCECDLDVTPCRCGEK